MSRIRIWQVVDVLLLLALLVATHHVAYRLGRLTATNESIAMLDAAIARVKAGSAAPPLCPPGWVVGGTLSGEPGGLKAFECTRIEP